jgi:hypothetical protein
MDSLEQELEERADLWRGQNNEPPEPVKTCPGCGKPATEAVVTVRHIHETYHWHQWCYDQAVADGQNRADRLSDYFATYYPPERRKAHGGMF